MLILFDLIKPTLSTIIMKGTSPAHDIVSSPFSSLGTGHYLWGGVVLQNERDGGGGVLPIQKGAAEKTFSHAEREVVQKSYFSSFLSFFLVCFTSYFVFRIAVLPHNPGVV